MTAETTTRPLPTLAELTPEQREILFSTPLRGFESGVQVLTDRKLRAFVGVPDEPPNGAVLRGMNDRTWIRNDVDAHSRDDEATAEFEERCRWFCLGDRDPVTWPIAHLLGADSNAVLGEFAPISLPKGAEADLAFRRHANHDGRDIGCLYCTEPPF